MEPQGNCACACACARVSLRPQNEQFARCAAAALVLISWLHGLSISWRPNQLFSTRLTTEEVASQEEEWKNEGKEGERGRAGERKGGVGGAAAQYWLSDREGLVSLLSLRRPLSNTHSLSLTHAPANTHANSRKPCRHVGKGDGPGFETQKGTSDHDSEEPAAGLTDWLINRPVPEV